MAQQYQDMVVDEADGKARYDLVDRSGNTVASGVALELTSPVVQEGSDWGALEANLLLVKDGNGIPAPRTDNPHKVTAAQVGAYTKTETDAKDQAVADGAAAAAKQVADALAAHKADRGNPHGLEPHQIGAYNRGDIDQMMAGKANTAGTYPGLTAGAAQQLTSVLLPLQGGTGYQFMSLGYISRVVTTDANGQFAIDGLRGTIAAVGNIGSNEAADSKHCVSFVSPQAGRVVGNVFEASTGRSLPGFTCRVNMIYFNI